LQTINERITSRELMKQIETIGVKIYDKGGAVNYNLSRSLEENSVFEIKEVWSLMVSVKGSRFDFWGCKFEFMADSEDVVYKQACAVLGVWANVYFDIAKE